MRKFAAAAFVGCGAAYSAYQPTHLHAKGYWGAAPALTSYQRDLEKSELKLWLSKKGVLSAVGHNLVLKVNDWESKMTMTPEGECELEVSVAATSIGVDCHWVPSKKGTVAGLGGEMVELKPMEAWAVKQITGTMNGKDILDSAKFPTVVYKGKGLKKGKGLEFTGTMSLKGCDAPLDIQSVITVEAVNGSPSFVMKGESTFLQSNWGIKPLSQFMGSLQLKDQITARWEVHFVNKEE